MEIARPSGLDEALAALAESPAATILAGGTDVMVEVNGGRLRPEHLVAVRRVEELKEWEGRRIGGGVTYRRLEGSSHVALAQLSRTVGSPQIRNAGTIGGNLGTASPAGDALPFLAAVDAHIELQSAGGQRTLRWDEFLTGVKTNALLPGELITAVVLPDEMPPWQAFGKVGVRSAMVISTVSAVVVRWEDGRTQIALGSVGTTPIRARRAEELISEVRAPSPAALAELARLVSEEVQPITDHRSTAEYRRHAAGVLARRLAERVAA